MILPSTVIYLDHNATAPLLPEALEAMHRAAREAWGNPSSLHGPGREARKTVEEAREKVAALVGCSPHEIIFTSGGTEACNLGIFGAAQSGTVKGKHIVVSAVEHPAVKAAAKSLETQGWKLTWIKPDADGVVHPEAVEQALSAETSICAAMAANNEIGTVQPIREISEKIRGRGIHFFCDAVQALGKIPLDLASIDLAAFAAHKIGGPKGVGALHVRKGISLEPFIRGGGQERNLRGGTENVPGIAGFGAAAEVWFKRGAEERERLRGLRDEMEKALREKIPEMKINAGGINRLPNTVHAAFPGCRGDVLVMSLDLRGISVSAGSACASGSVKPSEVMLAMGRSSEEAVSAVRFSLGWGNTMEEIPLIADAVAKAVAGAKAH